MKIIPWFRIRKKNDKNFKIKVPRVHVQCTYITYYEPKPDDLGSGFFTCIHQQVGNKWRE